MIARFAVTFAVAIAAYFVPPLVIGQADLSWAFVSFVELSGPVIAFLALSSTRRWGKEGRLIFRKRPTDEREARLMSETDSVSITLFLVIALAGVMVYSIGWIVLPVQWKMAVASAWGNTGPAWISRIRRIAVILQSMLLFILIQSVVGMVKFTRDR